MAGRSSNNEYSIGSGAWSVRSVKFSEFHSRHEIFAEPPALGSDIQIKPGSLLLNVAPSLSTPDLADRG